MKILKNAELTVNLLEVSLQSCLNQSGEERTLAANVHSEMFRFDVQIQFGLRQEFFFAHQAIGVDGLDDADGHVVHLDEMI